MLWIKRISDNLTFAMFMLHTAWKVTANTVKYHKDNHKNNTEKLQKAEQIHLFEMDAANDCCSNTHSFDG